MSFIEAPADRRTDDGLRWGVEPICRVLTEHGTPLAPTPSTTPAGGGLGAAGRLLAAVASLPGLVVGARATSGWLAVVAAVVSRRRLTTEMLDEPMRVQPSRVGRPAGEGG